MTDAHIPTERDVVDMLRYAGVKYDVHALFILCEKVREFAEHAYNCGLEDGVDVWPEPYAD